MGRQGATVAVLNSIFFILVIYWLGGISASICCIIAAFYLDSRVVEKALCEGSVPVLGVRSLELDFWCFRVSMF